MYPNFERDYLRNTFFLAIVYLDSMPLKTTKILSGKPGFYTMSHECNFFTSVFAFSHTVKLEKIIKKKFLEK